MRKKNCFYKVAGMILAASMILSVTACSGKDESGSSTSESTSSAVSSVISTSTEENVTVDISEMATGSVSDTDTSEMFTDRDLEEGYDKSEAIQLYDTDAVDGVITITEEGVYVLTGSFDGQIVIDADDAKVELVLSDVDITSEGTAAIYVKSAEKAFITAVGDSSITVTGNLSAIDGENVDGAIYAKDDLTVKGPGTLTINCENGHGIVGKDDLKLTLGTFNITASGDGIQANDSVRVAEADITISTTNEGIQVDDDNKNGFFYMLSGSLDITASTGKGIKAADEIIIEDGDITIDSKDDGLHSNSDITIAAGNITITTKDDAIHADSSCYIKDGIINITESHEGFEAQNIIVAGGDITVYADDDGFNSSGGNDTSTNNNEGGWGGAFDTNENAFLEIDGGTITIYTDGDGLDTNGYLYVNGGTTVVFGPTNDGNGALDFGISGTITGGTVVAIGSSGMAENFGSDSTQCSMLVNLSEKIAADSAIKLTDSAGNVIVELNSPKTFNSVVISTGDIKVGETYTLTTGSVTTAVEMTDTIYGEGSGFGGGPGGNAGGPGGGGNAGGGPGGNGGNFNFGDGDVPNFGEGFDGEFNPDETPEVPDGNFNPGGGSGGNGGAGGPGGNKPSRSSDEN